MNVALCNLGGLRESTVANAKAETELVFRSAGTRVVWMDCREFPPSGAQARAPGFVVRLRTDFSPPPAGPMSLDTMGRAFIPEGGAGYLADVYFQTVQAVAAQHMIDAGVLLGFVIAHELGHLLLGPGHVQNGLMQGAWNGRQTQALRQRWLKFNKAAGDQIRSELRARAASQDVAIAAR